MEESVLHNLFDSVAGVCAICGSKMEMKTVVRAAQTTITVNCKVCKREIFSHKPSSPITHAGNNMRLVYDSMLSGGGYTGYSRTCALLKTKPFHVRDYYNIRDDIGEQILQKQTSYNKTTRKCIYEHYKSIGIDPSDDGILDVDVSFDGSWLTRGHTSQVGVGSVIEVYTGFVLDIEVLSNYCHTCARLLTSKKDGKISDTEYNERIEKHKCGKNFTGKSGAM